MEENKELLALEEVLNEEPEKTEESDSSKIKKNIFSGIFSQIIIIAMSIILPRLYLENFGSEVNGVLSTIKQVFVYLGLLEAGVGLATRQALYKPLKGIKDWGSISSILAATHKYYIKTGYIYAGFVLAFAVLYAYILPVNMNSHVIFGLIILTAIPSLFSYFVQAKYRVLLYADGKNYIIINTETMVHIVSNIGKLLVLMLTDSILLIQLVYCICSLVQLVYVCVYVKREYEKLDIRVPPDFKAISQKDSVLVHQLSGMVFNNTDIILLSALCDFKIVSVYTIYNLFFSQMQTFISTVTESFKFKYGKMIQKEDDGSKEAESEVKEIKIDEEFVRFYDQFEVGYVMITFLIYTLMAVFLLPLIQIYTGGINDAQYSNALLVFLFAVMNLLANGKMPVNHVLEYVGEFKSTRSHAIIEMTLNIVVSVISIKLWGICGAIFGTIVALIYRSIVMIRHTNKKVLLRSMFKTYKCLMVNGAVFIAVMLIFFVDAFSGLSFVSLVIKGITHSIWIACLYFICNFIFFKEVFIDVFGIIRRKLKK